ncbi:hypothetical protein D9V29_13830 [Mycetocola manganoxydans]|uniref:Uncharacterized protein n=1 Tax=Mycetocola manganoxydans TaxID=699879 RepID=A0A3L6ZK08_9MICO|nr:hypothetical protein [Mycetocola manganoxydans]RLP68306.1 hypothetical protein D9V29_13830 [Mycetocola manganoxydans]GHD43621.1 hypothetical protein GCM10008097_10560 [Mycetocola manganoxydans]
MDHTRSTTHAPVRLLLYSFGLAAVWIVISLFVGTNSAHADDDDSRSRLGSVVSGAAKAVGKQLSSVTTVTDSVISDIATPVVEKVVEPLADVVPPVKKVVAVVPAVTSPVAEVVDSKPVTTIVSPITSTVDAVVAPVVSPIASGVDRLLDDVPVVNHLPKVSSLVGDAPLTDVTAPLTGAIDDVVSDATTPVTDVVAALPSTPSLPAYPGLPGLPNDPAAPVSSAPTDASPTVDPSDPPATTPATVELRSNHPSSPALPAHDAQSWADHINSGMGASPAASTRPHPDPVPRGPAENGDPALPSTPAASSSSGAAAGGPTGPSAVAELMSSAIPALISGALLSRAENDVLPSTLVLELSSTPD